MPGVLARGKAPVGVQEQRVAIDGRRVRRDGARAARVPLHELTKGAEGRVVTTHHWKRLYTQPFLLLDPTTCLRCAARTKAASREYGC